MFCCVVRVVKSSICVACHVLSGHVVHIVHFVLLCFDIMVWYVRCDMYVMQASKSL